MTGGIIRVSVSAAHSTCAPKAGTAAVLQGSRPSPSLICPEIQAKGRGSLSVERRQRPPLQYKNRSNASCSGPVFGPVHAGEFVRLPLFLLWGEFAQ
jgi:hypothetical protein